MKKRKVISFGSLPTKLPIWKTLIIVLALDFWNSPAWLCGVMGISLLLLWVAAIINIVNEEKVDLLNSKTEKP